MTVIGRPSWATHPATRETSLRSGPYFARTLQEAPGEPCYWIVAMGGGMYRMLAGGWAATVEVAQREAEAAVGRLISTAKEIE